jgi:hypothetical protein
MHRVRQVRDALGASRCLMRNADQYRSPAFPCISNPNRRTDKLHNCGAMGHVRQGGGNSGLAEVVRNHAARDGIGVESCGVMSPSISIIGVSNSAIASTCM